MADENRLTPADYEALGLYEAAAPEAEMQLELLDYLVSLGASADDLKAASDGLPGLASVLSIRGGPALTLAEVVERSGVSREKVLRMLRAAGFPEPGPEDRVFGEHVARLAAEMSVAEAFFGEEVVLQLARVMGSAASRIADAFVSAFLVNVEPALRDKDPVGLAVARGNTEGAELLPMAIGALDVMLRQHIIAAQRTILGDVVASGQETRPMAVGFVDLVGSTALSERLSTRDLGAALSEFEQLASDTVTSAGGRVVKLIGDEILFTAADEPSACRIALNLVAAFSEHPTLPPVRAGLAFGEVILRDGDVFGPVVIRAARAARVAESGAVVADSSAAAGAAESEPLGRYRLKGFEEPVELYRLAGPEAKETAL